MKRKKSYTRHAPLKPEGEKRKQKNISISPATWEALSRPNAGRLVDKLVACWLQAKELKKQNQKTN